jgi:hypothetical protein
VVGGGPRRGSQPTRANGCVQGGSAVGHEIPNLCRFEEPNEELFQLLTLPPVSLSNTAHYYVDEVNDKYYRTTVVPDAGGASWAPACGRLILIPVEWAPMFLDYPDSGTAFHWLVDLVNLVNGAERDKFTYLAWSMAYACLSASKEKHPVSTMSAQWKRMVMSRATKTWAMSAWMGQPPPDKAEEKRPSASASPPINNFSNVFRGQARRTAVTVPMSSPPSGRKTGTRLNPPKTGSGTSRAATGLKSQVGGGALMGAPRPAAGSIPVMGGKTASPPDVGTIICTMMEVQLAANMAMSVASNANMITFHTATAQALVAKNGDKNSKLMVAKKYILQACCGHAETDTFVTPVVYLNMDVEGGTTDALGRILQ